jgi:hypothetical protein
MVFPRSMFRGYSLRRYRTIAWILSEHGISICELPSPLKTPASADLEGCRRLKQGRPESLRGRRIHILRLLKLAVLWHQGRQNPDGWVENIFG